MPIRIDRRHPFAGINVCPVISRDPGIGMLNGLGRGIDSLPVHFWFQKWANMIIVAWRQS